MKRAVGVISVRTERRRSHRRRQQNQQRQQRLQEKVSLDLGENEKGDRKQRLESSREGGVVSIVKIIVSRCSACTGDQQAGGGEREAGGGRRRRSRDKTSTRVAGRRRLKHHGTSSWCLGMDTRRQRKTQRSRGVTRSAPWIVVGARKRL